MNYTHGITHKINLNDFETIDYTGFGDSAEEALVALNESKAVYPTIQAKKDALKAREEIEALKAEGMESANKEIQLTHTSGKKAF